MERGTRPVTGGEVARQRRLRTEVAADRLVVDARSRISRLTPNEAAVAVDAGALLVDIRPTEFRRRDGEVPGSVAVPRHVLEWRLDPTSPERLPEIADPATPVVLLCTEGYSSSLAADVCVTHLGMTHVADVIGGIFAWRAAGLPWSRSAVAREVR